MDEVAKIKASYKSYRSKIGSMDDTRPYKAIIELLDKNFAEGITNASVDLLFAELEKREAQIAADRGILRESGRLRKEAQSQLAKARALETTCPRCGMEQVSTGEAHKIAELESALDVMKGAPVTSLLDAAQLVKDELEDQMVGAVNPIRTVLTNVIERIEARAQSVKEVLSYPAVQQRAEIEKLKGKVIEAANLKRNAIISDEKGFEGTWIAIPNEDFTRLRETLAELKRKEGE